MESMFTNSTMKSEVERKLGEEVLAVGELRQGKPPSMLAMITGTALIDFVRPRSSKALPKHFLLAVTADRVIALKGRAISDEDGNDLGAHVREECGSWPRGQVSVSDLREESHSVAGTLEVPGERIPVFDPGVGSIRDDAVLGALATAR
jgi:hypothetical protein